MDIQIVNYSFNKVAKTITFTDFTSISKKRLRVISNTVNGEVIYSASRKSPNLGGVVVGNVLTLQYDTSLMDNNDDLQIIYNNTNTAATEELLELLRDQMENDATLAKQLAQLLKPLSIIASASGRLQVEVPNTVAVTAAQATAANLNANVSVLTNQVNMGGLNALDLQFNMAHAAWNNGLRMNVTF